MFKESENTSSFSAEELRNSSNFSSEQLKAFDIASENLLTPTPIDQDDVAVFQSSEAYTRYLGFVLELNECVTDVSVQDCHEQLCGVESSKMKACFSIGEEWRNYKDALVVKIISFLVEIEKMMEDAPPLVQPTRFGNKAFRNFLDILKEKAVDCFKSTGLCGALFDGTEESKLKLEEMFRYLYGSFGDYHRIDYGSGHEMNFVCFLYCIYSIESTNQFNENLSAVKLRKTALVCIIFRHYIQLCRKLQRLYLLEPAGSRGVWGLDDHFFLPFLWGASQLKSHKHLKPKSIRNFDALEGFASQNLYLESVLAIQNIKLASFAEHSPLLFDISGVLLWSKVNSGLIKMYSVEVLGKHAVIQHFIFSSFFPNSKCLNPIEPPQKPVVNSMFGHDQHGLVQDSRNRAFPNADLFAAPILTSNPDIKNHLGKEEHHHTGFKEMPCCSAQIRFPSAVALASTK